MLKQKSLSCLSLLFLLLMTWALSATDRKDFEWGFTSYYQVNYEETVLPGGIVKRLHYLPGGSVMVETVSPDSPTGTKKLYYGFQDHLFVHEYGHYIQSQLHGPVYLFTVEVYDSGNLFLKVENSIIDGASRTSIDYIKTYNLLRTKAFKLNRILLWAPR